MSSRLVFRSLTISVLALIAACATSGMGVNAQPAPSLQAGLHEAGQRHDARAAALLAAYLAEPGHSVDEAGKAIDALMTLDLARGAYGHAAQAWEGLAPALRDSFNDDTKRTAAVVLALRNQPAPRTERHQSTVATTRDMAQLMRAPTRIGNVQVESIIDTGANLTTITETVARNGGLTLLPDPIAAQASTGAIVTGHMAVGDIQLGDTLFRNAAIIVVPDSVLTFGDVYKIDAILGYPQLASVGRLRIAQNHIVLNASAQGRGAPIEMRGLDVYVDAIVDNAPMHLHLDTGARTTSFGPNAEAAFAARLANAQSETVGVGGAGGIVMRQQQRLPATRIQIGDATANVDASFSREETALEDNAHGRLGQDFYAQFASYTLDFDAMTLHFERMQ